MSKKTYHVHFLNPHGAMVETTVQCDTVHVDARGTKFLNGRGANAELVAFWPTERVVEVRQEVSHA